LRQQGREIISLAVGEPDFDTPDAVIAATGRALAAQQTRYGPTAGLEELRALLAKEFAGCSAEHIIVANGAKQALYEIFQVLCDLGDEIIVPQPCWVSFCEQIKMAGGRPVTMDTTDDQIDPDRIKKAITTRTRAILINSPNNPTGAVYPEPVLQTLAQIAAERSIYLISDEAYHAFVYDGKSPVRLRDMSPDPARVITVRSFSKTYNMTGYRVGYVAADKKIIQALARLQSHLTGNVCTFAQYGALAALIMDQQVVEQRRMELECRRDLAFEKASEFFACDRPPQGAFYFFPDVSVYLRPGETSEDLAAQLLEQSGVAVVPGEAFGGPGRIRISFGASQQDLVRGFARMGDFLQSRTP
jgi:aspartate aminotransferase